MVGIPYRIYTHCVKCKGKDYFIYHIPSDESTMPFKINEKINEDSICKLCNAYYSSFIVTQITRDY